MATIPMYFAPWCGDCRLAKQFLEERGVAYEPVNIEEQPEAADLIIEKNQGKRQGEALRFFLPQSAQRPTFEVDGRWFAASPFDPDFLAAQFGLK